jgi:23S rRNA (adenine2503-C2)-methyltransferase
MGMGEPLLNYDQVIRACRILLDEDGCNFSSRRITISTSGIVPRIYDLGRDLPTQLAISLNATTNEQRTRIMPINKKWPLEELLKALHAYPLSARRRITIEYVMLKDLNDAPEDARRLIKILRGIPVKVNLLPLNEHDRTEFETPPWDRVEAFQSILRKAGVTVLHRTPRGQDISAACGQLGETVPSPAPRPTA